NLQAPAHTRGIPRKWDWPGDLPPGHRAAWRQHLGGVTAWRRLNLPIHATGAGNQRCKLKLRSCWWMTTLPIVNWLPRYLLAARCATSTWSVTVKRDWAFFSGAASMPARLLLTS